MKVVLFLIILSLSFSANANELTVSQMERLCKVVDPTFLNQLPVYMEMKEKGIARKWIVIKHMRVINTTGAYGTTVPWATAIETAIDSPAKTPEEAIKVIEQSCVNDLKSRNN